MPKSSKRSLLLRFLHQNPVHISSLPHMWGMAFPSHSSWLDHSNTIWWREKSWCSSLSKFFPSPVTSILLGTNIFLMPQNWTPSAYVLLSAWKTKFHTHIKTTGKITVLYIFIFLLVDNKKPLSGLPDFQHLQLTLSINMINITNSYLPISRCCYIFLFCELQWVDSTKYLTWKEKQIVRQY